jgi:hypothetical protein
MITSPYIPVLAALLAAAPAEPLDAQQPLTTSAEWTVAVGLAAVEDRERALAEIRLDVQRQLHTQDLAQTRRLLPHEAPAAESLQLTAR